MGLPLGHSPTAPSPYVTWACYDDDKGQRQYEWGHYGNDLGKLEKDLVNRVTEYQRLYKVKIAQTEAPGLYKYYSTQRPVDIGTFPKPPHNAPDEIVNYEGRVWVENDTRLAWGHLTYTRPLTEQEAADYELRPSRENPDIKQRMEKQAQVVGKWEDAHRVPDQKRLTWFYPDFGSYAVKEYVAPGAAGGGRQRNGTPGGGAGPQEGQTPAPDCGTTESGPKGGPGTPGAGGSPKESPRPGRALGGARMEKQREQDRADLEMKRLCGVFGSPQAPRRRKSQRWIRLRSRPAPIRAGSVRSGEKAPPPHSFTRHGVRGGAGPASRAYGRGGCPQYGGLCAENGAQRLCAPR